MVWLDNYTEHAATMSRMSGRISQGIALLAQDVSRL